MDTEILNKLRSQSLQLSEEERAELAYALVASLDGPTDDNAGKKWDEEIARRLSQIDAGTAKLVDREELRLRIQERLGKH